MFSNSVSIMNWPKVYVLVSNVLIRQNFTQCKFRVDTVKSGLSSTRDKSHRSLLCAECTSLQSCSPLQVSRHDESRAVVKEFCKIMFYLLKMVF